MGIGVNANRLNPIDVVVIGWTLCSHPLLPLLNNVGLRCKDFLNLCECLLQLFVAIFNQRLWPYRLRWHFRQNEESSMGTSRSWLLLRHDVKSYVLEWNFVDAWVFFWNNEIHVILRELSEAKQKM